MSQQNFTYSSYRGMHSLVYSHCGCNYLHLRSIIPGSISDKTIVRQSGLLNHLTAEDLVLADKGFLIQDLVPDGVSVK